MDHRQPAGRSSWLRIISRQDVVDRRIRRGVGRSEYFESFGRRARPGSIPHSDPILSVFHSEHSETGSCAESTLTRDTPPFHKGRTRAQAYPANHMTDLNPHWKENREGPITTNCRGGFRVAELEANTNPVGRPTRVQVQNGPPFLGRYSDSSMTTSI